MRINGISSLVVTKLDVFDTQKEIQVCTGYRYKGTPVKEMPAAAEDLAEVTPEYRTLPGWQSDTYGVQDAAKLPRAAVGLPEIYFRFSGRRNRHDFDRSRARRHDRLRRHATCSWI